MDRDQMNTHLPVERISALLDEPWADLEAERHLDACDICRAEYEQLSRMRMALSGLGSVEPPAGGWERLEQRLDDVLGPAAAAPRPAWRRAVDHWPLQAAAALMLFAGGVLAGLQLTGPAGTDGPLADADPVELPVALPAGYEDADPESRRILSEFEQLRSPLRQASLEAPDGSLDPAAAAEVMVRLDALLDASRAAVSRAPADEFANAILYELVEERNALANRIEQRAHLTHASDW